MEATIDKFGRIVVPKKVRKALGISEGDHFELKVEDQTLVLTPLRKKARLVRKGGILIVEGGPKIDTETVREAIRAGYADREARVLGDL